MLSASIGTLLVDLCVYINSKKLSHKVSLYLRQINVYYNCYTVSLRTFYVVLCAIIIVNQ